MPGFDTTTDQWVGTTAHPLLGGPQAPRVKIMPAMMHGLGSFHRLSSYGVEKYADLG
jgi:hypothetical protein